MSPRPQVPLPAVVMHREAGGQGFKDILGSVGGSRPASDIWDHIINKEKRREGKGREAGREGEKGEGKGRYGTAGRGAWELEEAFLTVSAVLLSVRHQTAAW